MGNFGKPWKGNVEKGKFIKTSAPYMDNAKYSFVPKDKGNRRVSGATKVTGPDGVKYDSKLEYYMDILLRTLGESYNRQYRIVLQDKFRDPYTGEAVREIGWVVDFYFPRLGVIVDTKGWATEVFELKYKIFLRRVYDGDMREYGSVKFCKNEKECLLVWAEIKVMIDGTKQL